MKERTISVMAAFACLVCAVTACGRFFVIPVPGSPVPIAIQNMFAILAGVLLGPFWGGVSMALFLLLAALGLPVLSSGVAGLQAILKSPTAGFIVGYFVAAVVSGLLFDLGKVILKAQLSSLNKKARFALMAAVTAVAALVANAILFVCGVVAFIAITKSAFSVAMSSCVLPFIPGAIVKTVIIALVGPKLRALIEVARFEE